MALPPMLYVADLKPLLGWAPRRIIRFLDTNRLALRDGAGMVYTTSVMFETKFPEAYVALERKHTDIAAGREFNPDNFDDLGGEEDSN